MIDAILQAFPKYFPEINNALGAGIFIFARIMGFVRFAPVLNRKEIPGFVKLSFAMILTVILMMTVKTASVPTGTSMCLGIILNVVGGMIIGFIANCIVQAKEQQLDIQKQQIETRQKMYSTQRDSW